MKSTQKLLGVVREKKLLKIAKLRDTKYMDLIQTFKVQIKFKNH